MQTRIILSIKPKYCEEIFSGTKRFEYRRRIFRKDVQSVLIYATSPICKIVGEFEIEKIIADTPDSIWNQTNRYGGISRESYNQYFQGADIAYALSIAKCIRYNEPLNPKIIDENFVAPQSYRYVNAKININ